ncbi:MAG: hypothetical protein Q8K18_10290 [Burkholderiales bacterium]|nr:hypothetical protein [Burkholderiales bacterium]
MNPVSIEPARFCPITADGLNRGCTCRTLNRDRLRRQLEADPSLAGLADEIVRTRPQLFSATAVFISPEQLDRMAAIVAAVESVVNLPGYREMVLGTDPAIARLDPGPLGAFLGFDFHLASRGPQLIEINTNAGGALLNVALARAQEACCREMITAAFEPTADLDNLELAFFTMFTEEWRRQRGKVSLERIAIVDDDPAAQYLYPEFQLFERMFNRFGVEAFVADAREMEWKRNRLWHRGEPVDLVYNRLTDFYLQEPAHAALRAAYEAKAVVVTPNPRAHALYADKRNLVTLSDDHALAALGADPEMRKVLLAGVPRTARVTPETADTLWTERRKLFFKPTAGYGGKAAYRGDKLTRRVWTEILEGDYVAQAMVPPSERRVEADGAGTDLKLDVRAYVYRGAIQFVAARLYQGQTTNFRTPGGGFAPVFIVRGESG